MDQTPITILGRFKIERYGESRYYGLYDGNDLVCVTVYKKGAREVERRLLGYELALLSIQGELETQSHPGASTSPESTECPIKFPVLL